jgi:hypothetical protein
MSNLSQFTGGLLKFNTSQRIDNPATSTQSAAFQSDTVAIAIGGRTNDSTQRTLHFSIGSNPTATTNDPVIPNVASDGVSSAGLGGAYLVLGVNAGDKIACIRSGGNSVTAYIIELKY